MAKIQIEKCEGCHELMFPEKVDLTGKAYIENLRKCFCSDKCYQKALDEFLEPQYRHDPTLLDTPEGKQLISLEEIGGAFSRDFVERQCRDITIAWEERKPINIRIAMLDLCAKIDHKWPVLEERRFRKECEDWNKNWNKKYEAVLEDIDATQKQIEMEQQKKFEKTTMRLKRKTKCGSVNGRKTTSPPKRSTRNSLHERHTSKR